MSNFSSYEEAKKAADLAIEWLDLFVGESFTNQVIAEAIAVAMRVIDEGDVTVELPVWSNNPSTNKVAGELFVAEVWCNLLCEVEAA